MFAKKTFLPIVGVLLFLTAGAAYALPPRVSWIPPELKPESIAPGESTSYTLTLKHTGNLPIPATNQLKVVAEGDIVPFVTITQPKFPPVFKRGNQVNVVINITVSAATPLSVKTGTLVLRRLLPNGKEKEVWRADALPVELTFSAIPLPPDPGEEGQATLEGIDMDQNGVRDDIDRYIVFAYPNSAKVREALKQEARAYTPFLLDADDKAKTRENSLGATEASDCLYYIAGLSTDASGPIQEGFFTQFMNTKERSKAWWKANGKLGGTTNPRGAVLLSEWEAHYKAACTAEVLSATN